LKHPRPQFVRENWICLNGEWDFAFDDENSGMTDERFLNKDFYNMKINVPYSYHNKNSGVGKNEEHNIVWYKRELRIPANKSKRYILNFEAVDYKCDLWFNGKHVLTHTGGYTPFKLDITENLLENNTIILRVEDNNSCNQPIGKQSWKKNNFLCWYTRTVGIWQSVWIEEVGTTYLTDIRMSADIDNASLDMELYVNNDSFETLLVGEIYFKNKLINKICTSFKNKRARLSVDVSSDDPDFRIYYWNPDTPNLYDIKYKLYNGNELLDSVESYFGMRKVHTEGQKIFLNNQEFYQKLILDQGYFKDGGLTATIEELKNDVLKIKEMGFNGVRKHQKVEDNRFMYLCDTLGLVMWAEFPSTFEYSSRTNENIVKELHSFIDKHYNTPSCIVYTLFNESWGVNEIYNNQKQQSFVNALVYLAKSLDSSKLIVGNDGWEHTTGDILTIHDYNSDENILRDRYKNFAEAVNGSPSATSARRNYSKGYSYQGCPVMISEYGGIAFSSEIEGSKSKAWGYGERIASHDEVVAKIKNLTKEIMDIEYICGFCYTQLTDVEQEINGLLDHNHQYKFNPDEIRAVLQYKHNLGFVFK
jgi:beta-galactosidase/beta-glucuronidase